MSHLGELALRVRLGLVDNIVERHRRGKKGLD